MTWCLADQGLDLLHPGGNGQLHGEARFGKQFLTPHITLLGGLNILEQLAQPLIIGLTGFHSFAQPLQPPSKAKAVHAHAEIEIGVIGKGG